MSGAILQAVHAEKVSDPIDLDEEGVFKFPVAWRRVEAVYERAKCGKRGLQ